MIVEDDVQKYGRMFGAITARGVNADDIKHVMTAYDASSELKTRQFDLMLLDVNIPRRLGEASGRGVGLEVLRELSRDSDYKRPAYVVGVTAYEDVISEFGEAFYDNLWSLIHYSETSDRWISQLGLKLDYISASAKSRNFSDGVTFGYDLAILTALDTVELSAVKALPYDWQPLRFGHDETRYLSGTLRHNQRDYSVIACAAPRMGMAASSVLAAKIVHQFRPRFLALVGICAGRASKVKIGDIIVAEPTWDWGSGKIESEGKRPKFLPAPHQLDMHIDLTSTLKEIAEDPAVLSRIRHGASGKKPPFDLQVHFGPLVSGAAVVSHGPTFESLLSQHRGILGLDMEAYGVAAAALGSAKPRPTTLIVKGVCDYADEDKDDDFQEYAASISARFLEEVAPALLG